jgi:hypothetical protein
MESTEWVDPYPRVVDRSQQRQDSCSQIMEPIRAMSQDFGVLLYDSLKHPQDPLPPGVDKFFQRYNNYALTIKEQRRISNDLIRTATSVDDLRRAFNELNFHALNKCMVALWRPVLKREWTTDPPPEERLQRAQDLLALNGLWAYQQVRHKPRNIDPERLAARDAGFTGILNEDDTGIDLIEAVKIIRREHPEHDKLTVIAGPYQFEHGPRAVDPDRNVNVDFILIEPRGAETWVLGAQAKANARRHDRRDYDLSRMILIGAKQDFGAQPSRDIPAIDADPYIDPEQESWGGRLCAEAVLRTPTYGRGARVITGRRGNPDGRLPEGPTFMQAKMLARDLMRSQHPDLDVSARNLSNVILERL